MELLRCDDCKRRTKHLYYFDGENEELFCRECIDDDIIKVSPEWYKELQEEQAQWEDED